MNALYTRIMKRITLLLTAFTLCLGTAHAKPEATPTPTRVIYEFQGDEINQVFRLLARNAKINLIIDNNVTGTITTRLENVTPLQAIEIIASAKNLSFEKKKGIYVIQDKSTPVPIPPPANTATGTTPQPVKTTRPDANLSELVDSFTPVLMKLFDQALDYMARPETAARFARYDRNYYDALIKEGFTADEAFRLVESHRAPLMPIGK
jgi:type II secretory pathway component GspD/PulD (secretin)